MGKGSELMVDLRNSLSSSIVYSSQLRNISLVGSRWKVEKIHCSDDGKDVPLAVSLPPVDSLVTVSIRNRVLEQPGIAVRSRVRVDFLLEGGLDQDVFRAVCGVMLLLIVV